MYRVSLYIPVLRYRKISGDVCVPGDQTFYLPVVQDCPPKAPGDIDLVVVGSVYTVVAGTSVDFSFTQGQVRM